MRSGMGWCALARLLSVLALPIGALPAQDQFEIHVLGYEQPQAGEITFENHANYVGRGTTAATQGVFHDTNELTVGLTHHFSIGVMQLNGRKPRGALEPAGWRLVPHFYLPARWHLPLDLGLVTELSFQSSKWEADSRAITILPVLEKHLGRIQIDLNPTFTRALRGPDVGRGWGIGLAGRIGLGRTRRFAPSVEYYGDWGSLPALEPVPAQSHQILPGGDLRLARNVIWSLGVGFGLTPAADKIILKSRLEISFGGRTRH